MVQWSICETPPPSYTSVIEQQMQRSSPIFVPSMRSTDDSQPIHCDECGLNVDNSVVLKAHISDVHLDWTPYLCGRCPHARFATDDVLKQHIRSEHPTWGGPTPITYRVSDDFDQKAAKLSAMMQRCREAAAKRQHSTRHNQQISVASRLPLGVANVAPLPTQPSYQTAHADSNDVNQLKQGLMVKLEEKKVIADGESGMKQFTTPPIGTPSSNCPLNFNYGNEPTTRFSNPTPVKLEVKPLDQTSKVELKPELYRAHKKWVPTLRTGPGFSVRDQ